MRKYLSILLIFVFLCSVGVASAATLQVPSAKYKTIQSAINAAHDGDTVKVAYGTYNENLMIQGKKVFLTGSRYPKIYGADFWAGGTGQLYGFAVSKYGVAIHDGGGHILIRNCDFKNCGIDIWTNVAEDQIINNKFTNGGISIGDAHEKIIQGNSIYKAPIGLLLFNGAGCELVTKNTYSNCKIAVQMEGPAGNWMIRNTYIKNKVNFKIKEN